jgi:hypothetical protein
MSEYYFPGLYPKTQATFADALATVRRHWWGRLNFSTSACDPDVVEIPRSEFERLINAACYAHRFCTKRSLGRFELERISARLST